MAREQQRSFNVPFQVYGGSKNVLNGDDSEDSDEESPVSDVFKGNYNQFSFKELEESVIVLASDGLWDNVTSEEIQS
jgi:serine/threonine protein phosphatase PrpC